ncbi:hypothetical protein MMA231_01937 [Asticcacaulis sp. MM231]|uniref:DUF6434 domain-containing protein n=1 Tax=Asticcacaulis sp. MM231 TaxID=3157666 RepID=UPI0032D59256
MSAFDWHSEALTRETPLNASYKMTQNVRRFMIGECGDEFAFDRAFMAWMKSGVPQTLGDLVDEWRKRHNR